MRVAIVDDDPGIRALLQVLLEQTGCSLVGTAEDGTGALPLVEETDPDIVVMDWHMPYMDGIQAAGTVKSARPDVEVVAFTTRLDPEIEDEFAAVGADRCFAKPEIDELIAFLADRCAATSTASTAGGP